MHEDWSDDALAVWHRGGYGHRRALAAGVAADGAGGGRAGRLHWNLHLLEGRRFPFFKKQNETRRWR